jgi:asparagine synthase (glutamine-hydrolysing)
MCGIAGVIVESREVSGREIAARMVATLNHRGPDSSAVYSHECASLAHARLSIIDLEGGAQPMSNEDGTLWITFNGEIFNYIELREILLERGHKFATQSDTEVILHLFEDEGEECVHRLNGQWAFAIWNQRSRKLFLSRDRLGVRPLFYTTVPDAFLFASEIKAFFTHVEVPRAIDVRALDEIFTYWVTVPRARRSRISTNYRRGIPFGGRAGSRKPGSTGESLTIRSFPALAASRHPRTSCWNCLPPPPSSGSARMFLAALI